MRKYSTPEIKTRRVDNGLKERKKRTRTSRNVKKKNLFRLTMLSSTKSVSNNDKFITKLCETPRPKHFLPLASLKNKTSYSSRRSNKIKKFQFEALKKKLGTRDDLHIQDSKVKEYDRQNLVNLTQGSLAFKESFGKHLKAKDLREFNFEALQLSKSQKPKNPIKSLQEDTVIEVEKNAESIRKAKLINEMLKTNKAFHKTEDEDDTTIPFVTTMGTNFESFTKTEEQTATNPHQIEEEKKTKKAKTLRNISYLFEKNKKFRPKKKPPIEVMKDTGEVNKYAEEISQIRSILEVNRFPMLSNDLFSVIREMKLTYEERMKVERKMKNKDEFSTAITDARICSFVENYRLHGCHERLDSVRIVNWMAKMKEKYNKDNNIFGSIEEYFVAFKDILAFSQRELIQSEMKRCKEKAHLIEKLYQENVIFYQGLMEYLKLFLQELDSNHFQDIGGVKKKHENIMEHQHYRYHLLQQEMNLAKNEIEELKQLNKKLRNKLSNDLLVMKQLRSDIEYSVEKEQIMRIENKKISQIITEMHQELTSITPQLPGHHQTLLDEKIKKIKSIKKEAKKRLEVIHESKETKDMVENSRLSVHDKQSYLRKVGTNSAIVELDFNTHHMSIQTDDLNDKMFMRSKEVQAAAFDYKDKATQLSSIHCPNCKDLRLRLVQSDVTMKVFKRRMEKMMDKNSDLSMDLNHFRIRFRSEREKRQSMILRSPIKQLAESIIVEKIQEMESEDSNSSENAPSDNNLAKSGGFLDVGRRRSRGRRRTKSRNISRKSSIMLSESPAPQKNTKLEKEIESMILDKEFSERELFNEFEKADSINKKTLEIVKDRIDELDIKLKLIPSDHRNEQNDKFFSLKYKLSQYKKFNKKFSIRPSAQVLKVSKSTSLAPRPGILKNITGNYFRSLSKKKKKSNVLFTERNKKKLNEKLKLANTLFNEVLEDIRDRSFPKDKELIRDSTLIKKISKYYADFANQKKASSKTQSYKIQIFMLLSLKNSHRKLLVRNFKKVKQIIFILLIYFLAFAFSQSAY